MCGSNPPPRSAIEDRQRLNKFFGFLIPLILVGVIGYATWVLIVLIGVHYLMTRHGGIVNERPHTGIAIIVLYFIILFPMACAYLRVVSIIYTNPGYVLMGPKNQPIPGTSTTFVEDEPTPAEQMFSNKKKKQAERAQRVENGASPEKPRPGAKGFVKTVLDHEAILRGDSAIPPGTENFYSKDVFQCRPDGIPIWCGVCNTWKPDRAHHCSDVGQCVMKLDHFCPWVGGTVGEANIKFFIQFCCYAALYTFFILVTAAWAYHDRQKKLHTTDANWAVIIALATLFFVFTGGMAGNSIQHLRTNITTVDAIDAARWQVYLAIRIREGDVSPERSTGVEDEPKKITPERKSALAPRTHANLDPGGPIPWNATITYPIHAHTNTAGPPPVTFAVVQTPRGLNPWSLSPYENAKAVMGNNILDWFLPLRISPECRDKERGGSAYPMGKNFDDLKRRAGITYGFDHDHRETNQSEEAIAGAHEMH